MVIKSQSKYIGVGTTILTILALLGWFNNSDHFETQWEGDSICAGTYEEPCEWNYNITLTTINYYYIRNNEGTEFNFIPDVKEFYNCKKDGRMKAVWRADRELAPCGIGWREFDWKTPLTSKYKYVNKFYKNKKQEFKIVVFKNNPEDVIKFGGEITKDEFDPYFYGIEDKIFIEEIEIKPNIFRIDRCENKSKTKYLTCFNNYTNYYNSTFINNKTGINESIIDSISSSIPYDCNPYVIYYKDNCKTIGVRNLVDKLNCPYNFRCDVIKDVFWMLSCADGDCNFDATQHLSKGWTRVPVSIYDIKEIKLYSHKDLTASIEKI